MLVIAHRGFHAAIPENTMAAFAAAAARGVDGIETDVRLSRDGEAVLVHDRVLGPPGYAQPVSALTRQEAEALAGHPIPLLAEALDALPDLLWNVEIKTVDALAETMRVLGARREGIRVFVTSFRHDVALRVATQMKLDCGLLLASRLLDFERLLGTFAGQPRVRGVVWDFNILDDALVQQARASGWTNYVYGPVTPGEHDRCRQLELAGVITDYPGCLGR